jgi:hypothetical protein
MIKRDDGHTAAAGVPKLVKNRHNAHGGVLSVMAWFRQLTESTVKANGYNSQIGSW